jgi:hypothetical protein
LPALPASFIIVDFVDEFEDGFVSLLEIFWLTFFIEFSIVDDLKI